MVHTHQHGAVDIWRISCSVVRQEIDDLRTTMSEYSFTVNQHLDYFSTTLPYPVHLDDYTWLGGVVTKCRVIEARTVTQHVLVERTGPLGMFWSTEFMLEEILASSTVVIIALFLCGIIVC